MLLMKCRAVFHVFEVKFAVYVYTSKGLGPEAVKKICLHYNDVIMSAVSVSNHQRLHCLLNC